MAFSYSPKIITDGLVLYLDAANPKSYVSGSTTWRDLTRNSNNGTLTNGPTFSSANGGSIAFDGVDDFCAINYTGSATENYTWEVWAKAGNLPSASFLPLVRGRDGFGGGWSMALTIGASTFGAFVVTTTPNTVQFEASSSIGITPANNVWYNVVGTWTAGSKLEVYVNGNLAGTRLTTSTNLRSSTTGWNLATITNSLYYNGSVSITRIYNRALTATEIQQNYNATKGRYGL